MFHASNVLLAEIESSIMDILGSSQKLNVHAPAFVPGRPWKGDSHPKHAQSKPLVVYGDLDPSGNSISNPKTRQLPNQRSLRPENAKAPYTGIEQPAPAQPRPRHSAHPHVDNASKAMHCRMTFDRHIGANENDLRAWQDLCFFCGHGPEGMPTNIGACKKWLSNVYVNIFDLAEAIQSYSRVEPYFDNAWELEIYSKQTGKICPAAAAYGNRIFSFLFKRWSPAASQSSQQQDVEVHKQES